MKGLYLTQEGKQDLENKIAELERLEEDEFFNEHLINDYLSQIRVYKEMLSSATIIPNEKSWDDTIDIVTSDVLEKYPNGVIIQSKK